MKRSRPSKFFIPGKKPKTQPDLMLLIWLLLRWGKSATEIAETLGTDCNRVYRLIERYRLLEDWTIGAI